MLYEARNGVNGIIGVPARCAPVLAADFPKFRLDASRPAVR